MFRTYLTFWICDITSMECIRQIKTDFQLKEILDFNVPWNFQRTDHVLATLLGKQNKQLLLLVFTNKFLLPSRNLEKQRSFTGFTKLSAKSQQIFWTWFLLVVVLKEKYMQNSHQTNRNHDTGDINSRSYNLIITLVRYSRLYWNCKSLVEARKVCQMLRFISLFFLWNYTYNFENMFICS